MVTLKTEAEFAIKVMTLKLKVPLFQENGNLQFCAKVMQKIIDEYRDNRDLSAIFERQLA